MYKSIYCAKIALNITKYTCHDVTYQLEKLIPRGMISLFNVKISIEIMRLKMGHNNNNNTTIEAKLAEEGIGRSEVEKKSIYIPHK